MKKIKLIVLVVFLFLFNVKAFAVDYSASQNWVVNECTKENTNFDVFYVYPTLFTSEKRALFDWSKPENQRRAKDLVIRQTHMFKKSRIYAPYTRQHDLATALNLIISIKAGKIKEVCQNEPAITDTKDALKYYIKHYNNGRPFILLGHSQGAVDILLAMKEVDLGENFIAAYLIGCPNTTTEFLSSKNAKPATGKSDLRVVVTWNSQKSNVKNPYFSTNNGCVINPLNWRTDEKPASRFKNFKSEIYDHKQKCVTIKHFVTGARIDKKNGVLLLKLPTNSNYDNFGLMGEGVFHTSEFGVFSNAIVKNAEHRVKVFEKLNK